MRITILFDVSYCEDLNGNLLTVTPEIYFDDYECVADFVDEELFSVLDDLGFAELSESTFEYCGELNSIEHIKTLLFNCVDFHFEQNEEFSSFLNGTTRGED